MITITEQNPWGWLICKGVKPIENRTWKCPGKYIGKRVLIHSGARWDRRHMAMNDLFTPEQWESLDDKNQKIIITGCLPESAIIGSVVIIDCVINHPSIWAEKSLTDYSDFCKGQNCKEYIEWECYGCHTSCKLEGESHTIPELSNDCPFKKNAPKPIYNWVLANPILFNKPISAKGKLSFWESDVELCHICGKPTSKDSLCERCDKYYCGDCAAPYNQFSQIDYNCCVKCYESMYSQ